MPSDLAELELELRLLPGVVNVALGPLEQSGHVGVTVVVVNPESDLEDTATRVARSLHSAATIEIVDLSPPRVEEPRSDVHDNMPRLSDERVALVASAVDDAGEAFVELALLGSSSRGSGSGGPLIGSARATLEALRGLGFELDADLVSVSTGRGVANSPVRVILRTELAEHFEGVARGASAQDSAARATLAAFNRYLERRAASR